MRQDESRCSHHMNYHQCGLPPTLFTADPTAWHTCYFLVWVTPSLLIKLSVLAITPPLGSPPESPSLGEAPILLTQLFSITLLSPLGCHLPYDVTPKKGLCFNPCWFPQCLGKIGPIWTKYLEELVDISHHQSENTFCSWVYIKDDIKCLFSHVAISYARV